jgi:hypothetical protein
MYLNESQPVFIPFAQKHQLINKGSQLLEVSEIQSGIYFYVNDIVRYQYQHEGLA